MKKTFDLGGAGKSSGSATLEDTGRGFDLMGGDLGVGIKVLESSPIRLRQRVVVEHDWSKHQQAIFKACSSTKSSLIVKALAGTGKTTTVVEALKHLRGKTLLCAFNKRIADELAARAKTGDNLHISTLHSLGFRLVQRVFPNTQVNKMRGLELAKTALFRLNGPKTKNYQWMVHHTAQIVKEVAPFIKVEDPNAWQQAVSIGRSYGHFDQLASHVEEVTGNAVLKAMEMARKVTGEVDYSDMLYVPLHNVSSGGEYDNVIVDEAQDMNAAQLYLAQQVLKEGGRLIVVGDEHQAIYGFRGADSGSMKRLEEKFKATVLDLPVTYRCARSIVTEANLFVPDLKAGPDAPSGTVEYIGYNQMITEAKAGDFILSRINAPLLRLCLMFIKESRPAMVAGRDIGNGLLQIITKMTFNQPMALNRMLELLRVWKFKQIEEAEARDDEERVTTVTDQVEALLILSEECTSIDEVKAIINRLFDDTEGASNKIICSTVHKAKGLESNRVFILCDTFKGGWDGGEGEEANLKYVAITRAKSILSYVEHPSPPKVKPTKALPSGEA